MQQIYRRTHMPKCDFNKVTYQLRHGSSPVNLLHIFRTPFPRNTLGRLLLVNQRQNGNGYSQNSVYSFWSFGDTDTVTDIETLTFCLHCTNAVFTNLYLLGQRYYDLFHRSFKMLMKYLCFYYER